MPNTLAEDICTTCVDVLKVGNENIDALIERAFPLIEASK